MRDVGFGAITCFAALRTTLDAGVSIQIKITSGLISPELRVTDIYGSSSIVSRIQRREKEDPSGQHLGLATPVFSAFSVLSGCVDSCTLSDTCFNFFWQKIAPSLPLSCQAIQQLPRLVTSTFQVQWRILRCRDRGPGIESHFLHLALSLGG